MRKREDEIKEKDRKEGHTENRMKKMNGVIRKRTQKNKRIENKQRGMNEEFVT